MDIELDHVFICTDLGAPEAARLVEFGLTEGPPNRHPGQGTANRRFFFENAFLELLWVEDAAEAASAGVQRTGLWERWRGRAEGASPFGICLRPAGGGSAAGEAPFESWVYAPVFFPPSVVVEMAIDSDAPSRPLLFHIARKPDAPAPASHSPSVHPAGLRQITRVTVHGGEGSKASPTLRAAESKCSHVKFVAASEWLLELGFDGEAKGESADFRPGLPLVLRC